MPGKIYLKDVTFLIPLRIETIQRLENLKGVTDYLLEHFATNIILLEASAKNNEYLARCLSGGIAIHYIKDNDVIFHRTRYLNLLTLEATTPFIAIWDSDVIVRFEQLLQAVNKLREGTIDFVFPYDGAFLDTGFEHRNAFLKSGDIGLLENSMRKMVAPYGFTACGGGFLANKDAYQRAGMENENFYGWGPEDGERVKRWDILGMRMTRVRGPLFHLSHPRGINSGFRSEEDTKVGMKELLRICKMSKEELEKEIASWHGLILHHV